MICPALYTIIGTFAFTIQGRRSLGFGLRLMLETHSIEKLLAVDEKIRQEKTVTKDSSKTTVPHLLLMTI